MPRLSLQILLSVVALLCVVVIAFLIPPEFRKTFLKENGVIENATLFGYIYCVYLLVRKGGSDWVKTHWRLVLIPLLLLAREADFHARFTEFSIFGTKYFFGGSGSVLSLAVGAVVVLLVIWVFGSAAWKYARQFLRKLRNLEPDAAFIGIALLLAIAAKTIDGTARDLTWLEMIFHLDGQIMALLIEETLELGIPLALCLAAFNCFHVLSAKNSPGVLRSKQILSS